jgi:hypothetical protein
MQKQKLWIPLLASAGIGADAVYSVTRGPKFIPLNLEMSAPAGKQKQENHPST